MTEQMSGTVVSVNLSPRKTMRKTPGECALLVFDRGFENDAHAGDWHRQVSLLAQHGLLIDGQRGDLLRRQRPSVLALIPGIPPEKQRVYAHDHTTLAKAGVL